jgi:hypothetical protein
VVAGDEPAVLGGFTPAALAGQPAGPGLRTVFCAEGDWRRAEVEVTQAGATARLMVSGDGDLEAAAAQACRFLALDVDARGWPEVGRRDPVIGGAQAQLPGLRPCGFHSPYEAAAWAVLAQRLRIAQAARLRAELIARHGEDGAFPAPHTCPGSTWIFQAVRVSICGRSPRPRSTGCWTARRCAPSTPARPSSACSRSRGSARSPPNWSWSAARTPRRPAPPRTQARRRDHRAVRPRPHPHRNLAKMAALPHLGRRSPPRAARAAHRRDRRPLSHPDMLSGRAVIAARFDSKPMLALGGSVRLRSPAAAP